MSNYIYEYYQKIEDGSITTGKKIRQWYEYIVRGFEKKDFFSEYGLENASSRELHEFYDLLCGKDMTRSYDEIFAPVFILNAIDRSLQSGCEENVHRSGV